MSTPNAQPAASAAKSEAKAADADSLVNQVIAVSQELGLAKDRSTDIISELIKKALAGTVSWDKNTIKSIENGIKQIDAALSEQLAAIMHHPKFLALEGTWRGLNHLVMNSETSTSLKIKVINVGKRELFKDLDGATEFDQSQIFKRIYEAEFDTPGGNPFGAMIGDYQFSNHPEDLRLLEQMSGIAAAAHCPFVTSADPKLFGFKSFTDLSGPRDLAKIFDAKEYAQWNKFRESPDARYVAMTLPSVLARTPYGEKTITVDEFDYEEVPQDSSGHAKPVPHDHYCWMNAAYVYGTRLTNAFAKTNWCTAIVGKENGGAVEGLPMHYFMSDSGDTKIKCPSEVAITGRRDAELGKLGFLPLCWYKDSTDAVFFESQTLRKPKRYPASPKDQANEEISACLPYIMASSRIAHYLKMIARDKLGSFMEASDCQAWLEKWISGYVLADPSPSAEMKAKYPLKEFKVEVRDIPGNPGAYNASILMRPWLIMKELNTALSMVAEIPKK